MDSFQRMILHTQTIKSFERSFIQGFIFPFLNPGTAACPGCLSFAVLYQGKLTSVSVTLNISFVIKLF